MGPFKPIGAVIFAVLWSTAVLYAPEREGEIVHPAQGGNENVFIVGEELVYNVRYGFISLGKITVTITDVKEESNGPLYRAKADIASYSGVPFVSLHHIYQSDMSPLFYSVWFESLEKNRNEWDVMRFDFDYDRKQVRVEEGPQDGEMTADTLELETDEYLQDGLSLFYFARGFAATDEDVTIPTLINKEVVTTDFVLSGESMSRRSKAFDHPVEVVELRGRANFSGIFGMTGAFRGWFTNDDAAVPVEAKLRVLIGNVTVELIEWNRPGWNPPRYASGK